MAKKAGAAIAAAFAVKKVVEFGKACINLGSDLQEVQNVVDVTFPTMSKQANEFAKSAISTYGLSETMAKKYTGTYGAMAKSFGFAEQQALDMGKSLTGLTGDVASFYNITQDEAYTKLKSVFTGETESLKELGVVMTQNALDSFALANGYGKVTSKMTEAEKVALRYNFVQNQLASAQGDFARTSDGWANQMRVLNLQLDSLKAKIGQGLINLFSPLIKLVNQFLEKLNAVTEKFNSFTEILTGKKTESSGMSQSAAAAAVMSESTSESADNVEETAKEAKKLRSVLAGFDAINVLSFGSDEEEAEEQAANANTAPPITDIPNISTADIPQIQDNANPILAGLKEKMRELKEDFKEGLKLSLNAGNFDNAAKNIKSNIDSIKQSLKDIVLSDSIKNSFNGFSSAAAKALGQITGAVASVGASLADFYTGSVAKYLGGSKDYIIRMVTDIINGFTEIISQIGNFCEAAANIFSVFQSDEAKEIGAHLMGIFSDAFLGVTTLVTKLASDIIKLITQPIIDNADKIKEVLINLFAPIGNILGTLHNSVKETFEGLNTMYDQHIRPLFESLTEGLSDTLGKLLDFINDSVVPVLENWASLFDTVYKEHIQPMIDEAIDYIGAFADCIKALWETIVKPFIDWIIANILPTMMPVFETIGNTVIKVGGFIADAIKGQIEAFKGILNFITGVLTGDWEKAFGGIKDFTLGTFATMEGIINGFIELLRGGLTAVIQRVKGDFEINIAATRDLVESFCSYVKTNIVDKMSEIKTAAINAAEGIKEGFETINGKITACVGGLVDDIKKALNKGIDYINGFIGKLNKLNVKLPDKLGGGKIGFNIPTIPKLARGGIINQPTLAMVGEQGKEAVMPLENNTGWIDELAGKIAAIISAASYTNNKTGAGQPLVIELNIGGTKFGKVCADSINALQRKKGKVVLEM